MPQREPLKAYEVAIANSQRRLRVSRARLSRVAKDTLAAEGVAAAEISIALVDDAGIQEINREFLGHDYPTDVISFLLEEHAAPRSRKTAHRGENSSVSRHRPRKATAAAPLGAGKSLSGEVIISAETALRSAPEYNWRPADELCLYLVHGLLHLCGYDDLSEAKRRLMRRREAELLRLWGLVPSYAQSALRP